MSFSTSAIHSATSLGVRRFHALRPGILQHSLRTLAPRIVGINQVAGERDLRHECRLPRGSAPMHRRSQHLCRRGPDFRIVAPMATERNPLKKNCGTNPWAVVNREIWQYENYTCVEASCLHLPCKPIRCSLAIDSTTFCDGAQRGWAKLWETVGHVGIAPCGNGPIQLGTMGHALGCERPPR